MVKDDQNPDKVFKSGFVALIGYTNTGKSTLLNQLLDQKIAIVTPKPQTTRNKIVGILTSEDAQIIFIDTPGLHQPHTELNRMMIKSAWAAVKDADIICFLTSIERERQSEEQQILHELARSKAKKVLLVNKIDLAPKEHILPILHDFAAYNLFDELIPISALRGINVDRLLQVLNQLLPEGPQYFDVDQVTEQSERFLAAELIREVIFEQFQQEIPYCTLVEIDKFLEASGERIPEIWATIYVEKASQKGIIIGKGGQSLKAVGIKAREEITRVFGIPVILKLWVKVHENWRSDAPWLKTQGVE